MTQKIEKTIYTAYTHTTGGRDGKAISSDKLLEVQLAVPKEMGGSGAATNPEQLFAAGYSACFMGAIRHVAAQKKVSVPADTSIDAAVDIGPIPQGFGIAVKLDIHLPGLEKEVAQDLINSAHQICPYSNATRGNIEVTLNLK